MPRPPGHRLPKAASPCRQTCHPPQDGRCRGGQMTGSPKRVQRGGLDAFGGGQRPGKDGSASYLPCFLVYLCSFKWSWEAGYHVLPWLTMISKSYLVFISLSQWWFGQFVVACSSQSAGASFSNTYNQTICTHEWPLRIFGEVSLRVTNIPMGVSKNRGIPKWMVYNGKPY